ncbi:MAG TPA: flagellar type III secretion system pore protein FliP [Candidatus Latescibacteria bacterium]|nr:flagellar type III secretion system pore protein FliP [Candidatus Latescibacterota bacterium]
MRKATGMIGIVLLFTGRVWAQGLPLERALDPGHISVTLQILLLLTTLALAPSILVMLTSFTRIIVVLSFLRHALGTQQSPPNQLLIGLALFLTAFIMAPVWKDVNDEALQPYIDGKITQKVAVRRAMEPVRDFMFRQTREKDLMLFFKLSGRPKPGGPKEVPTHILVPAFIVSELRVAFQIGFLLYVPFLMIDMIVASVLMSMGMLMLPPVMISLPFKLLLFVLVDGWYLLVDSLVASFGG